MELRIAQRLVEASMGDLELREAYSGRWMYGETTAAIIGEFSAFIEAAVRIGHETEDDMEADDLAIDLGNIRSDSMGMDTIWY